MELQSKSRGHDLRHDPAIPFSRGNGSQLLERLECLAIVRGRGFRRCFLVVCSHFGLGTVELQLALSSSVLFWLRVFVWVLG